ncbi:stage V sporulation protein D [Tepidibacter formicigenes]|uniref:Stage V sporulation protein D (Sporulation-specific penicillin-binding protein) n=1 Tax=Tepidibacter formicigenes DSM 15518 TaxID=1123349 RepID=A0A1M6KBC6_9FIRM|nr:stage V sporulation protein D [Tepidibacter formicigenes]SHJ56220.1 stage V sporulation protein D (sporulation-specific penicillin-binding protein) [Tepidibacter formicigenes DSM 15518]
MSKFNIKSKTRLVVLLFFVCFLFLGLIIRVGYLQIVKGDWLNEKALSQQTRDISVEPKRGTIYDRKGKELAVSVIKHTVWAKPSEIKDKRETSKVLAQILDEDENEIYKIINENKRLVKIKRWIDDDKVDKIKKSKVKGIWVSKDNKRYYPYGNFAAHILGYVSADNSGGSGIELEYDKDLRGLPGRNIISTDASGRKIPYGDEKYNEPKDGLGVVLTIDEVIQHYAEKAVDEALQINKAKKVHAIVMDPKTGDILAMVSKPDYNPNDPRTPIYHIFEEELSKYEEKEKIKGWFKMWRNPIVNDVYEPGSTFKLIVASAGLEEGVVTPEEEFYDKGYIDVAGRRIKDAIYPRSHGKETFAQAIQNSCNPVFVEVGQRLGVDKLYDYINAFGFTQTTGIDLPGEGQSIVYNKKNVGPVELATISFGQGISVTPIQLITAISAIANDGELMKPRVVKELVDSKGNVVKKFEPEGIRRVISEETSKTLRKIMEAEVVDGGGNKAYIPGYHVGGKTGTAQKVINGRYAKGRYISSFVGIAPADNPKVVVLAVVDEPNVESYYGGITAAPIVKEIIYNTLRYLDVKPTYTEEEKKGLVKEETIVPEVRNLKIQEGGKVLLENKLNYMVEPNVHISGNERIIDMFPKPGVKVPIESNITLYIETSKGENNEMSKVSIPDFSGKTIKEVANIIQGLGLKLKPIGNGKAVNQNPLPNSQVDINSIVTVEFK